MAIGGSRRKETSKKSTLDYREVYDELVNQNEIAIKMTATKEEGKLSRFLKMREGCVCVCVCAGGGGRG